MVLLILKCIAAGILLLFFASFFLPIFNGSSRFGTARFTKKKLIHVKNKGVVVDGVRALTLKQSYEHIIGCGPTGKGKSQLIILPTLFKYSLSGSIICTDPKSELSTLAAPSLKKMGVNVQIIDFGNPFNSLKYNPLKRLKTELDIQNFASAIVILKNPSIKDKMDIWLLGAINIIAILIAVIKNHPDPNFHTMATLIKLLSLCEDGTDRVQRIVEKHAPSEAVKMRFHSFINDEFKIKKGKLASAKSCVSPFDNEQVKELTSNDNLDFSSFRKKRTVLFLKMPVAGGSDFTPIVSLFCEELLRYLLSKPPQSDDLPLLFLFEEFGNLPVIKSFSSFISLARSFKISIAMVVQNLSQIYARYNSEADTILANSGTLVLLPGIVDQQTLKHAVNVCGTISYGSESQGKITHRNLLNPDEIKNMNSMEGLALIGNNFPMKIKTLPFYRQKRLLKRLGIRSINNRLVPAKDGNNSENSKPQVHKELPSPSLPILDKEPPFNLEKDKGDNSTIKQRLKDLLRDDLESE